MQQRPAVLRLLPSHQEVLMCFMCMIEHWPACGLCSLQPKCSISTCTSGCYGVHWGMPANWQCLVRTAERYACSVLPVHCLVRQINLPCRQDSRPLSCNSTDHPALSKAKQAVVTPACLDRVVTCLLASDGANRSVLDGPKKSCQLPASWQDPSNLYCLQFVSA